MPGSDALRAVVPARSVTVAALMTMRLERHNTPAPSVVLLHSPAGVKSADLSSTAATAGIAASPGTSVMTG
jgi:hypothetical protein